MWDLIKHCIPNDHARQVQSTYYIDKLMKGAKPNCKVLDLGCGVGRTLDIFRNRQKSVDWSGLDIEGSPEVSARTRDDGAFYSYNGVDIPFEDGVFDIVYSHQVFEHVRYPEKLLAEVTRVLRPGGAFIGSVSSLEPYHSFSYWSFTPYGWMVLLQDAGMVVDELRPGIDGIALSRRLFLGRPKHASAWFKKSPLNEEIDIWAKESKRRPALVNLRKLQFCGHLAFWATKPTTPAA